MIIHRPQIISYPLFFLLLFKTLHMTRCFLSPRSVARVWASIFYNCEERKRYEKEMSGQVEWMWRRLGLN